MKQILRLFGWLPISSYIEPRVKHIVCWLVDALEDDKRVLQLNDEIFFDLSSRSTGMT